MIGSMIELSRIFDRRAQQRRLCRPALPSRWTTTLEILDLHGQAAADHIMEQVCVRVLSMIRGHDIATRLGDNGFLIALRPSQQLDLEACIQMAGRIQSAVEDPSC